MRYNFFLEIYSEDIPYLLQVGARDQLLKAAEKDFRENNIKFKNLKCLSTPKSCLLYTSPSPRDLSTSRMPSSA